jgi:hypothetical protein
MLGILNILACGLVLAMYAISFGRQDWDARSISVFSLPLLIPAAFAFICGVFTLKGRSWWWAGSGLVVAALALIYPVIVFLVVLP